MAVTPARGPRSRDDYPDANSAARLMPYVGDGRCIRCSDGDND